ncbi:Nitroreductase-like protein [Phaeosphaeriaceae sp. PMI808]|nr:Nitroreductase-like protein [Phaeosphaeriaceae sp. PMI808]
MTVTAKPLLVGLLTGLFLAWLVPQLVSLSKLPLQEEVTRLGSYPLLSRSDSMAQVLRDIAKRGVGGYKSLLAAPYPSISHHTTSFIPSLIPRYSAFSTTTPKMSSQKSFLDAVQDRRTYYALNKEAPISDKRITELVEKAVLHVPSSFNSQSTRLVVLLNKEHDTFWDYVLEVLKPLVPEAKFPETKGRIDGFRGAYGTILFYEDPEPVEQLRKDWPPYAHHFGDWSEQTNAMHQFALWVALEAEGFGANIQHYNPVIDAKAAQHWNVPLGWKLRSQLVFGGRIAGSGEPSEKQHKPTIGTRFFVHGAKE